ncbi:hypothetical protein C8R43DRAFT_1034213 [Mycena crocata]|nr:hypothetical protein C8R43DRAFT_1034213 [Mycena crocata]
MAQLCGKCGAALTSTSIAVAEAPLPVVTRLLYSNDAPIESDIALIRRVVSTEEHKVEVLDAEIEEVQVALELLMQRRKDAADSVRQHRAILSPIRRIPAELICEILALSTADYERAPWHLGFISSSWRNPVLSYPLLWCSIHIGRSHGVASIPMLETQLLRSANTPLTVSFSRRVDSTVLALLLQHRSRWSTLKLLNIASADVMALATVDLPHLERLEVLDDWAEDVPLDVFATSTPSLREFILLGDWWQDERKAPTINLPWQQLQLYRGSHSVERQLQILRAAPHLVECSLRCHDVESIGVTEEPLTLPHLRRLYLYEQEFLRLLTAPLLEVLLLSNLAWNLGPLLSFIHRSSCQLTKLVLTPVDEANSTDLIDLLRSLPSLTYLFVEGGFTSGSGRAGQTAFLDSMTVTSTSSDLCPNLRSLMYGMCGDRSDPPSLPLFIPMVESRFARHPSSHLTFFRVFNVDCSSDVLPDAWAVQLQFWRDQGLDAGYLHYTHPVLMDAIRGCPD